MSKDQKTADAFANSWNNLPLGSVYSYYQFKEWLEPLEKKDIKGRSILELGCGNAGLMVHMAKWDPFYLKGVDLGDSVTTGIENMKMSGHSNWKIEKADLVNYKSEGFDLVYCIGVLHHLKEPKKGFESVIRNTKPGGRFHVWVYAREGNAVIRYIVDPLRKAVSNLPWWVTKYCFATPLAFPYFIYAKLLSMLPRWSFLKILPLYHYGLWISHRGFNFFQHVAFDQLVTPQTTYIERSTIEEWLGSYKNIDKKSIYIIFRNGNSWKFGGRIKNNYA